MLVARQRRDQAPSNDDRGAVLVSVIVVMIVGFIVAATVAASAIFTVQANDDNRDNLAAFVAAESGRDVAVAAVVSSCSATTFTGTSPSYTATVYSVAGPTEPTTSAGLGAPGCPTTASDFVVINSVGTGPDGSSVEIDSVYPWQKVYTEQPGGTLSYFSQFSANKSTYEGDLVVREGAYTCPNLATIDGDLWVVDGSVTLSTSCHITGSVYARGTVDVSSQGVHVDGDIVSLGDMELSSNDVVIGGGLHSGGEIVLKDTGNASSFGKIGGPVKAVGAITIGSKWKKSDGTAITPITPSTTPVFDPTLEAVYGMTTWIDLSAQNWGTGQRIATCQSDPSGLLDDSTAPLILDYTACAGAVVIAPQSVNVTRDAVFLVAPTSRIDVQLKKDLTATSGSPQLMFIHTDAVLNDTFTCDNSAQKDKFIIPTGVVVQPRIMMYSPCGLTGSVKSDFHGQLYTANDGTFAVDSTFVCEPMSWLPSLPKLSCLIHGEEEETGGPVTVVQSLGELRFQTEK